MKQELTLIQTLPHHEHGQLHVEIGADNIELRCAQAYIDLTHEEFAQLYKTITKFNKAEEIIND